jgi:hypothetical protein
MNKTYMSFCSTAQPDWSEFRKKYTPAYWAEFEKRDTHETLYIQTRWVNLYTTDSKKVDISRIRDNHELLNVMYGGRNTDELAKVPNTERCPFKSIVGIPNIQFLPLDASQLQVEYKHITEAVDGKNPVFDAADKGGITDGVLNIYIGDAGTSSILGQADIEGNIVFVDYRTVGGYTAKGMLPTYDGGKTAAHEVGHALGLRHTFEDHVCDNYSVYTDIPEQIKPNFQAKLVEVSPGTWEIQDDNRTRDLAHGTTTSCLSIQPNPANAPTELGIDIMDYAVDDVTMMFSQNQVDTMRSHLLGVDNTSLKITTTEQVAAAPPALVLTQTSPVPAPVPTEVPYTWTTIAIIIAVCAVVLFALCFMVHRRMRVLRALKDGKPIHIQIGTPIHRLV